MSLCQIQILNRVVRVSESDKAGVIQLQSTIPVRCLPAFGGACSIDISLATEAMPEGRTCVGECKKHIQREISKMLSSQVALMAVLLSKALIYI